MRWASALIVLIIPFAAARADEADDLLAKRLAAIVRDPRIEQRERVEAARTLSKLGTKANAAVPDLIQQVQRLKGTELENLQEAVIEALGAIGAAARPAIPALVRIPGRSTDLDLAQKKATETILGSEDSRDILGLIVQLRSADVSLRLRATKALAAIGPEAILSLPAMTAALEDRDGDVRRGAIEALRQIVPTTIPRKAIAKAYIIDLRDDNGDIRLSAIRALSRLGDAATPALPLLEALQNDPEQEIRKAAAAAMARIPPAQ